MSFNGNEEEELGVLRGIGKTDPEGK